MSLDSMTIRLSPEAIKELEFIADAMGWTRSQLAAEVLLAFLAGAHGAADAAKSGNVRTFRELVGDKGSKG